MRAKQIQMVAAGLALAALTVMTTGTHAQVLAKTQVRDLAAKADTPAQHMELRNHFATLADRYEAEAKRYAVLAKAYIGNPNRPNPSATNHWNKLSDSVAAMAKDARELATYHGKLAEGVAATHPTDASHLEHGTGAPTKMTDAQLQKLVASARTPSEHGQLREYFTSLVTEYTQDAESHAAMAAGYRANPRGGTVQADHCERLVRQAKAAAAEARALAAEHAGLAK